MTHKKNKKHYKEMNALERELYTIHFASIEKARMLKIEESKRKKRVKKVCLYKFRKKICKVSSL